MSPDEHKTSAETVTVTAEKVKTEEKASTVEQKTMSFEEISAQLEKFFTKTMPAFPKGLKEFLVKFIPWINLVLMIIAVPLIIISLGAGAILSAIGVSLGGFQGFNVLGFIGALVSLGGVILTIMALPGLFKRQYKGWQYSYWSVYVSAIANLISGAIIGTIFSVAISLFVNFYILFQIKEYYKKDGTEVVKK